MNKDLIKAAKRLVSSRGVPLRNSSPRKSPVVGKRRRDVVLYSALKISKQPLILSPERQSSQNQIRFEDEIIDISKTLQAADMVMQAIDSQSD